MKKIKFLNGFVFVLIVVYSLYFLGNAYITFFTDFTNQFGDVYNEFIFGYYTQFVGLIFSALVFIGLFSVSKGLGIIIKVGFFNTESATKLKTAGKLFLISGLLSALFSMLLIYSSSKIALLEAIGQDFLLMVIGFSLYIIADILQNGNVIKQENDLTI